MKFSRQQIIPISFYTVLTGFLVVSFQNCAPAKLSHLQMFPEKLQSTHATNGPENVPARTPVVPRPVLTTPVASTPIAPAPVAPAPVAPAPVASAPVASAPVASAPVASAPVASAPVASAPVASAPVASAPVASAPVASAPVEVPANMSAAGVGDTENTRPASADSSGVTRPYIELYYMNEDQYDAAYKAGARGDALLPLAGVYFKYFEFTLNGRTVNLEQEILNQEFFNNDSIKTYSEAVTAINKALDLYKAQFPNDLALRTVRAELGTNFKADLSPVAGVGIREGTSILLTVDPKIGVPANSISGFNILYSHAGDLRLGKINFVINTFPNSKCYESIGITEAAGIRRYNPEVYKSNCG